MNNLAPMKRRILKMVAKARMWLARYKDEHICSVLVDGNDNSVTLSSALVKKAGVWNKDIEGAIIVRLSDTGEFAIVFKEKGDPRIPKAYPLQYNALHRCIGFESLTPMVNRILFNYGKLIMTKQEFRVKRVKANVDYYKICRAR